jgi:2-amino-4-hydroxy-6-hydroxymethyldihydropteridine diphosphokinase
MARHRYLVALGSNMRHPRHGSPRRVIAAALRRLDKGKLTLESASDVSETPPLGPSRRNYANAVCVVTTRFAPARMLRRLQKIEKRFGRRRMGADWGARVLDLDLVLWSGGAFVDDTLVVPHPLFRERAFVLEPAAKVAGDWRDPLTGLTVRQLAARLTRPRSLPR